MSKNKFDSRDSWSNLLNLLSLIVFLVVCVMIYFPLKPNLEAFFNSRNSTIVAANSKAVRSKKIVDIDKVKEGIHVNTGLYYDSNLKYIQRHCMGCHSTKLIAQNRAEREGWKSMIRWMQSTQGLHDLGVDEPKVLDYLSKYYKPLNVSRRPNLDVDKIEWYVLEH